eukprot:646541-Karenia_brevis.AAC.1
MLGSQPQMLKQARVQRMTKLLLTFHMRCRLRCSHTLAQAYGMTKQIQTPAIINGCPLSVIKCLTLGPSATQPNRVWTHMP